MFVFKHIKIFIITFVVFFFCCCAEIVQSTAFYKHNLSLNSLTAETRHYAASCM